VRDDEGIFPDFIESDLISTNYVPALKGMKYPG